MPAMAGDWPRDPRAYGSPQHTEPPAPVRTLPSVAELLSRPSAESPNSAYHHHHHHQHQHHHQHHDYFHARSTPPSASLAPTASANTTTTTTTSSYWSAVNLRGTSPPLSPTEQRPPATVAPVAPAVVVATAGRECAPRVYQEPTFRRQQVSKPDQIPQHSALSSGLRNASNPAGQVRQDSAIDQHRFEAVNDAQSSKPNISYSHRSPKGSQRLPSPTLTSYQTAPSTAHYTPCPPTHPTHQDETYSNQAGLHPQARQHSNSISSGSVYLAALPSPQEPSTERTVPVDIRNGAEMRPNITGPSSLPEHFFTQQNHFGTRQQRYNVRFAANYTSENMPTSQKPRNEPPTPPTAPATIAEPEHPRSSPPPTSATHEIVVAPKTNGTTRQPESFPRVTREARDRSDREPSVERCLNCNEAWKRPIPDLDQVLAPAESEADYRRITSNIIDRLRDESRKVDAAYEDWKWRHSHCYRPASPHSTSSADDTAKRTEAVAQADGVLNGNVAVASKRKSEVPHELHSAKQRRVTSPSPAPPARKPGSS